MLDVGDGVSEKMLSTGLVGDRRSTVLTSIGIIQKTRKQDSLGASKCLIDISSTKALGPLIDRYATNDTRKSTLK